VAESGGVVVIPSAQLLERLVEYLTARRLASVQNVTADDCSDTQEPTSAAEVGDYYDSAHWQQQAV
jgi:hypothetical protein